jgi:3',5'-cyclic AMP phosphodiesterase CpdA
VEQEGGDEAGDAAGQAFRRHFEPKFERTFGWLAEARIPAYVILGNHDLRSPFGAECEIGYSLAPGTAWRMPFYFYQVEVQDPSGGPPLADLFALHSAPRHAAQGGENYVRIGPRQGAWLRAALAASRARWKLEASHHPIWSAGRHAFTEYLSFHEDLPAAAREADTRLDLLLAGHNHWLESVRVALNGGPALQVVSGSLSKVALAPMLIRGYPLFNALTWNGAWRKGLEDTLRTDPGTFLAADRSALTRGFALVDLAGETARVQFYGVNGLIYGETFTRAASASRSALPMGTESSPARSNHPKGSGTGAAGLAATEQRSGVSTSRKWE